MTVRLRFVQSTGDTRELRVEVGRTALEAGLAAGVPELESECGGACTCAACHVRVEPAWFDRLPPPSKIEAGVLSIVEEAGPESRLSCQIRLTEELDGLILHTMARAAEA